MTREEFIAAGKVKICPPAYAVKTEQGSAVSPEAATELREHDAALEAKRKPRGGGWASWHARFKQRPVSSKRVDAVPHGL